MNEKGIVQRNIGFPIDLWKSGGRKGTLLF